MSVLLAVWFASGAVMTFADYPAYTDAERLAAAPPLPVDGVLAPPELRAWIARGGLSGGARARLVQPEGEPVWVFTDGPRRRALHARSGGELPVFDVERARAVLEQRVGRCAGAATELAISDQWTVGRTQLASYPLFQFQCDDALANEYYVSARTGEIVQQSTRSERLGAWVGAIPHWIYPAVLRRDRELWRMSVLVLATFALVASTSGLAAGVHALRVRRRARAAGRPAPQRHAYLRWHQRIGLVFGCFASTWIFSGALSLSPFEWSGGGLSDSARAALYRVAVDEHRELPVAAALERCSRELDVREAELAALDGVIYVVCSDPLARTRIVDSSLPDLTPRLGLTDERIRALGVALVSAMVGGAARSDSGFAYERSNTPDAYYYPTHRSPIVVPFVMLTVHDREHSALYFDPSRAALVAHLDERKRVERWLFNGLHSLDFAWLYTHGVLWRVVVIGSMVVGCVLAISGLAMIVRTARGRRVRDAVQTRRASSPSSPAAR